MRKLDIVLNWQINVASKLFVKNTFHTKSSSDTIMKVLNVAEKNDAAKNIASILSRGMSQRREGFSMFNKIYEFECYVLGRSCKMVMTSVSGHLLAYEFGQMYRPWHKCQPVELFSAPVHKMCPQDTSVKIKKTLQKEIKYCDTLIVWTDCDREGENIGFEIIDVCKEIKPDILIYRAKFSEITPRSIKRAIENLDHPNELISAAVDVRSELDLRIGAAFTRFQTLRLKKVFPAKLGESLISYGSCQFPTLGFVVERYNEIQNFITEDFWKLKVDHKKNDVTVEFSWKRVRLFDKMFCKVLYERCLENSNAVVEKVVSKAKSKWRPTPLDTVEFEKIASKKLGLNAKEAMRIAEKLYSQGFISYPRTETNIFPKELNLVNLVQEQTVDPSWGDFATRVVNDGPVPRQGKKTDEAHPPIHPTKYTNSLLGDEKKVYEFIVRRFLACVSSDAKGHETIVEIDIKGEKFVARGLMILERNYLDVYPYEKWSDKEIHKYEEGERFKPTSIDMIDGQTKPPNLLTEADLIALMERHGIGTDATHAEHIETIKKRLYVGLNDSKYFVPGQLGMGLVEGYDNMGFQMSKPYLRAELEADLQRICEGRKSPQVVLSEQIEKYKEVFIQAQAKVEKIDESVGKYLEEAPQQVAAQQINTSSPVFKCPSCGQYMTVRKHKTGTFCIGCNGYPGCKTAMWFRSTVLNVDVASSACPKCGPEVKQLKFTFRSGAMSPFYPNKHTACVNGCDRGFLDLLGVKPLTEPPVARSTISRSTFPSETVQFPTSEEDSSSFQITPGSVSMVEDEDSMSSSQRLVPPPRVNFRPLNDFNDNEGEEDEVRCQCKLPAIRLIVLKESVNKGRPFYKCGKRSKTEACNFFKWADEQDNKQDTRRPWQNNRGGTGGNGAASRGRFFNLGSNHGGNFKPQRGTRGGAGASSGRKCGVCHKIGHTRRNCPEAGSPSSSPQF